ncbi:MFS transporter [Pseudomonas palleroniana]|uniref:MFS transporter n=1 Tax=Pseudomonas palleroniana TaxID=191390 RepID=UPI0018E6CB6F|nr:MFS transporter [Pseudomonas palleroniana]MBI6912031.1 MFS transporter [Pseudomonas palleroniana]
MSPIEIQVPEPRRWLMFAILLVGAFLPPLDFFIVNVALPSIQEDLGTGSSAEQLVISSYATLYAVTLITGGRLGDLYGRGRMFFLGLLGFAAASLMCGLAASPWLLILGRALQGVTAAVMAPQALASVQAIFPASQRALALSLYGAVFGLASVIGQALGGVLIAVDLWGMGWRAIFLVNLPIAMLVIAVGMPVLKETRALHASKLDLVGTALSMLTLTALVVPLIEGREAGWPLWAWLSLVACAVLAVLFWRYETRLHLAGGNPILAPAALKAPGLGRALLVALCFYSIGVFFLMFSMYLQGALQMSALHAGLIFLPFGAGFLLGPLSVPLLRRLLGDYVNPVGMGLEVFGLLWLGWLMSVTPTTVAPPFTSLAAILFLIGLGQGLALPTLMRMVTGRVAPAYAGMIAGITSATLQISTSLSVALIGGIFYTLLGEPTTAASITHAFTVSVLCIAACLAVGAVLSLTLARQPAQGPQASAVRPT